MTCQTALCYALLAREVECYEDVRNCLQFILLESESGTNEEFFTEWRWEELVTFTISVYQNLLRKRRASYKSLQLESDEKGNITTTLSPTMKAHCKTLLKERIQEEIRQIDREFSFIIERYLLSHTQNTEIKLKVSLTLLHNPIVSLSLIYYRNSCCKRLVAIINTKPNKYKQEAFSTAPTSKNRFEPIRKQLKSLKNRRVRSLLLGCLMCLPTPPFAIRV
eukprot:TRINITY_DN2059_c0_g1_i1.p1 TRINITY_DN2059_c0_g1~~TRINITY_DN2059_c0_g1_i1.p1  ORF type:complete len:259 (+),score=24.49 TRINITY_DN2059_c0_g1_i1:116-778(+)